MLDTQYNHLNRHVLTKNEYKILFALENRGKALTVTQLAKQTGVQRGTIYANLRKLTRRGLIFAFEKKYSCSLWHQQEIVWWKVAEALYQAWQSVAQLSNSYAAPHTLFTTSPPALPLYAMTSHSHNTYGNSGLHSYLNSLIASEFAQGYEPAARSWSSRHQEGGR